MMKRNLEQKNDLFRLHIFVLIATAIAHVWMDTSQAGPFCDLSMTADSQITFRIQ